MLNPDQFKGQLPLFMRARELRALPSMDAEDSSMEAAEATYAMKLGEAQYTGLHAAIGREGVKDPVEVDLSRMGTPHVYSGNHRVASAAVHDKEFVPVLFHENGNDEGTLTRHWRAYPNIDGSGRGSLEPDDYRL